MHGPTFKSEITQSASCLKAVQWLTDKQTNKNPTDDKKKQHYYFKPYKEKKILNK